MKAIRTAIIDDGISIDESLNLINSKIIHLKIKDDKIIVEKVDKNIFIASHGTVCYWIYADNVNRNDYELYSIKVIDPITRESSMDNLRIALEWCLENDIKLICMSIGTTNFLDFKLDDVLRKLYEKNVIMIAACSNKNIYTYPASSQYVLGVKHDYKNILPSNRFSYNEQDISNIEITCNGDFDELGKKVHYEFEKYNSFIVPYIASVIHKVLLEGNKTINDIKSVLKSKAIVSNELATYEYFKNSYKDWTEEIDIPIIAIVNDAGNSTEHFTEHIVNGFRSDKYNAVLLQDGTNNKEYYKYSFAKLIEVYGNIVNAVKLVINSANTDILLIDIPFEPLDELTRNNLIDIVVKNKNSLLFPDFESIEVVEFNEIEVSGVIAEIYSKLE